MSDHHALSGAYAVDALDDAAERQAFERHLATCETCRAEVDGMRETAALLAETCAVEPPAGLRATILAQTATTRPLPPLVSSLAERREQRHARTGASRTRRLVALVAAAAAVVAVGVGVGEVIGRDSETPVASPVLSDVDQVLAAPDAETFTQDIGDGSGTVTVVRSKSLNQAVLQTRNLPEVPDDKTRELWLRHGNEYLPAGYLPDGTDHTMLLDGDPASAKGFGISIEQASGASSPSDDLLALMPFTET
jgi:anti-sigma-K factor RskA